MNICKNCGEKLIEKATKRTAEQLEKAYYFRAYYWCPNCKKLYHDEKFKVVNNGFWTSQNDVILGSGSDSRISPDVEIWTDGACTSNGKPNARASWAFVTHSAGSGQGGDTEKAGLVEGKQTNNRGEAFAIYHGLLWAAEKGYKKIRLHTDSQISIHGVSKHHSLVKVNREIFEQIANVIDKNNLQVEYVKVLGHSGNPENDRVDRLANTLAKKG